LDILAEFPHAMLHTYTPGTARQASKFPFETVERLSSPDNLFSTEGETEKRTAMRGHHLALCFIHLEFESSLEIIPDTAHHPFTRQLALHQNDEVVSVTSEAMASCL
jgi:hypothetical protein